jgi:hypothetical protein
MEIGHGIPPAAHQVSASYARQIPADRRAQNRPEEAKATEDKQDAYIPSNPNEKKAGYGRPVQAEHAQTIERLQQESNRIYGNLKEMVRQMLERQGLSFKDIQSMDAEAVGRIQVDEATRTEASAAIAEGGDLSPEAVSDRIVDYAKALSGEDKSKLNLLRKAIDDGFAAAEKAWGGELPEISRTTYDLIMEKLDAWEKGDEPEGTA